MNTNGRVVVRPFAGTSRKKIRRQIRRRRAAAFRLAGLPQKLPKNHHLQAYLQKAVKNQILQADKGY